MHAYPKQLKQLILTLKKLPGVGNRSAERFAFQLLDWKEEELQELGRVIGSVKSELKTCALCGCLLNHDHCQFCDRSRDAGIICVVSHFKDVYSIEETDEYHGLYHVLGGVLSPMDGIGPDKLSTPLLKQRIGDMQTKELIIAIDSTLEGDATSLYLKEELKSFPINISRLAFGLPMGSSLDYVDGGTLARALHGRGGF